MTNKEEELSALSNAVEDIYEDIEVENRSITDKHHILYTGNIDAKIMVVKMHPNFTELFWAKQRDTHSDALFIDDEGHNFKRIVKSSKFNPESDFLFTCLVPFYCKNQDGFDDSTILKLSWIYKGLVEIINPSIIITLGYKTFNCILNYDNHNIDLEEFELNLSNGQPFYKVEEKTFVAFNSKLRMNKGVTNTLKMLHNHYLKI